MPRERGATRATRPAREGRLRGEALVMFWYRAVCTDPTGRNHQAKLSGSTLQFDGDLPITLPFPPVDLWMAANEFGPGAITVDGRDVPDGGGDVYLVWPTGTVLRICAGTGLGGAKIRFTAFGG